jgi:hypothetical protein
VIANIYAIDPEEARKCNHAPFWGSKLIAPAYYTDEKYQNFLRQWGIRLKFENLKFTHALENTMDKNVRKRQKEEIM